MSGICTPEERGTKSVWWMKTNERKSRRREMKRNKEERKRTGKDFLWKRKKKEKMRKEEAASLSPEKEGQGRGQLYRRRNHYSHVLYVRNFVWNSFRCWDYAPLCFLRGLYPMCCALDTFRGPKFVPLVPFAWDFSAGFGKKPGETESGGCFDLQK